jgi:predicted acetyltransferase
MNVKEASVNETLGVAASARVCHHCVMDDLELRPLREQEFAEAVWVASLAFGEHPAEEDKVYYREGFDLERSICAFLNGNLVGVSTALSLELTLPGGSLLPAGGLTWIAVLPTHRRRGVLRQLVSVQLQDMIRRGEPVSALLASEGGIYRRFGYGPATSVVSFQIPRARATFIGPVHRTGRITLLKPDEAVTVLPAAYENLRMLRPGEVSRPGGWWQEYLHDAEEHQEGAGRMFHATHESSPGVIDGYATYRIKEDWPFATPRSVLRVVEVMSSSYEVYAALWDFLLNTDLVETVAFSRGRVDEPLRWLLTDPRSLVVDGLTDYLWLRLLDVPRALSARVYGSAAELVIEVADTHHSRRSTRFGLRTGGAGALGAECSPSSREPDLTVEIDGLAAAYLGGVTFATLAAVGRVRELRPGAVERATAMFSTATAPYCTTMF